MKPRVMLIVILVWSALLGCYLGSTLGFSSHELDFEKAQCLANTNVESNGFLMRLFYILFWIPNGPHSDFYLRLPNLILSLASLVAVYLLGTEIVASRRQLAGILSAFYLGINALFISVLAHMRFYSANMFLIILATYCLIKARRWESGRWLSGYAACMAGAVGTMMLSSLAALPHALYYVGSAADRRRACRQVAILSLGLGAWFYLLYCRDPEAVSRFNYQGRSLLEVLQPLLANGYAGTEHIPQIWHQFCQNYTPVISTLMILTTILLVILLAKMFSHLNLHGSEKRGVANQKSAINRQENSRVSASCESQTAQDTQIERNTLLSPQNNGAKDGATWLSIVTIIFAIVFYRIFSATVKPIDIPHNVTWVIPFVALSLTQATLEKGWRWLYLVLILNAVPQTHMSFLAQSDANIKVMHTLEVWRHPGEPLLVCTEDMAAWHYLCSEYGADRRMSVLSNPARVGVELAIGDGLLVYNKQDFPAIMSAICQQRRLWNSTVWVLTFKHGPSLACNRQRQADNTADFLHSALARALWLVRSDYLIADGAPQNVLYRISLPAVRQYRPTPLRYRLGDDYVK